MVFTTVNVCSALGQVADRLLPRHISNWSFWVGTTPQNVAYMGYHK